ncbi:hypothetical protein IH992_21770 [Candidatus Poribacteria bacterium]|nr:hypothetical protein [Candidatus Poribacteria bacterium]
MRIEDQCIIYKCLNGEPEAFGFLVDRYKESVYAFVYSKVRRLVISTMHKTSTTFTHSALTRMAKSFGLKMAWWSAICPAPSNPPISLLMAPGLWLLGDKEQVIPARESAQIVREVAEEFGRPFTVIVYPNGDHGLRDVDSGSSNRIYWVNLLRWLDSVIR